MQPENSDSKVHGANMGPIWGRQDPGGPHVGPMNFAIWGIFFCISLRSIDRADLVVHVWRNVSYVQLIYMDYILLTHFGFHLIHGFLPASA